MMEAALAGLGVVNPVGVVITKLVAPGVSRWNAVVALTVPAGNATGLMIVPTAGTELEKGDVHGDSSANGFSGLPSAQATGSLNRLTAPLPLSVRVGSKGYCSRPVSPNSDWWF